MKMGSEGDTWLNSALDLTPPQRPFPWQKRLLDNMVCGALPAALDLPTGLGKTAVIAVWLVARALGAPVPRRLVYVVDRRAVVDQATTEAERLRTWVEAHVDVKAALALEGELPISTLRGQHADNRRWLEDPASPAIVIGTVDMIGSRLLFSGYGVSRRMRPYHAGQLGADALIVLDEAHLSQPFERLIEQIAGRRDAAQRALGPTHDRAPLLPLLRTLSLSATGRHRAAEQVLQLGEADRAHPTVARRLTASKRLVVRDPVAYKLLPDALAEEAWGLAAQGTKPVRTIVFCNSRDQAQKLHDLLHKRAAKHGIEADLELFVGGRRIHEREAAARMLATLGFVAGSNTKPQRPSFVIATAAGEVGVDLSADHAVCDLVAWERMVQRLGRVNRRGDGEADIVVVPTERDERTQKALAAYERWQAWARRTETCDGDTTAIQGADNDDAAQDDDGDDGDDGDEGDESASSTTRKGAPKIKTEERRLAQTALRHEATLAVLGALRRASARSDGPHDASPNGLLDLRQRAATDGALAERLVRACTPAPLHPPLTRALVEAWALTAIDEHTGRPDVAPWIRGWPDEEEEPQTTVVWRRQLPIDDQGRLLAGQALAAYRDAADPHLLELLETETWRVFEWLTERLRAADKISTASRVVTTQPEPVAVPNEVVQPANAPSSTDGQDRAAVTHTVDLDDETSGPPPSLLRRHEPAAVLLDGSDGRARAIACNSLRDGKLGDDIERALRGATLMVDCRLGGLSPQGLLDKLQVQDALDVTELDVDGVGTTTPEPMRPVPFRIRHVTQDGEPTNDKRWRVEARIAVDWVADDVTAWLEVNSLVNRQAESEEGRSSARHAQLLAVHQHWAEDEARRIAAPLKLPEVHVEMLAIAARLHDEGKQAPQWQLAFGAPTDGAYAKTTHAPNQRLLNGYRHELGSLPYAEADAGFQALPPELRALCLHLIAAHHGHSRPTIGTQGASEPPSRLAERTRDIALRFFELQRQWGPWGLAWWESLLRAADQRASRRNDDQGAKHG